MTDVLVTLLQNAPRLMTLEFPDNDGPAAVLLPETMLAKESISRDFEFTLTLLSDDASIALKDVQARLVCVHLLRDDGSVRYFNGHCFHFSLQTIQNGLAIYRMVLKPWLAFYDLNRDHFIFQHQSIGHQTEAIFKKTGLARHEFRLKGKDPMRTYSVQYGESDYNYLHRRWEEMGWCYWYDHSAKGHTLVLSDQSTQSDQIDGKGELTYHHNGGSNLQDKIAAWRPERNVVADKVAVSGFDFKKPTPVQLAKSGDLKQGDVPLIETYHYAGLYGFKDAEHGNELAMRKLEQQEAEGKRFKAKSNCRHAQAGRWFKLDTESSLFDNHADGTGNDEYLILKVKHTIHNNYLASDGKPASYRNKLTCLRRKISWRPQPGFNSRPVPVPGVDTATVVGLPGEEIYTDKYGRIKVKFHWDRKGRDDGSSSCWIRVQTPWANKNFGIVSVPRIGTEVVIQYLHNNPDLPVVSGQFYNERHMPPWDLPANQTQSGVLTRSSKGGTAANANALRFEDKKGQEQVWLHAERNFDTSVEHNDSQSVGNDRHIHVKGKHDETIDKDMCLKIDGGLSETVKLGMVTEVTDGAQKNTVKGDIIVTSKDGEIVLSSPKKITFKVGDNSYIVIEAGQITIQSPMVDVNPN